MVYLAKFKLADKMDAYRECGKKHALVNGPEVVTALKTRFDK